MAACSAPSCSQPEGQHPTCAWPLALASFDRISCASCLLAGSPLHACMVQGPTQKSQWSKPFLLHHPIPAAEPPAHSGLQCAAECHVSRHRTSLQMHSRKQRLLAGCGASVLCATDSRKKAHLGNLSTSYHSCIDTTHLERGGLQRAAVGEGQPPASRHPQALHLLLQRLQVERALLLRHAPAVMARHRCMLVRCRQQLMPEGLHLPAAAPSG